MIDTKDTKGYNNGYVYEVLKEGDRSSAYITACYPGMQKGIHYHDKYQMRFTCIRGKGEIIVDKKKYLVDDMNITELQIDPGHGILIKNTGLEDLWILSCPNPPWRKEDYVSKTIDPEEGDIAWKIKNA